MPRPLPIQSESQPESAPPDLPSIRGRRSIWTQRNAPIGLEAEPRTTLAARILAARGFATDGQIDAFLNSTLRDLHDPSLIPDLDRAAQRLLDALSNSEPIAIYGDYDVDGITATTILYHTFKTLSPDAPIRTYIPHRLDEGYGLNAAALTALAGEGVRVVVSVDCGITAIEPARAAKDAGLDLIITDHHNPPERIEDLPDAFAVVHPRRPDSAYPFDELCGAGVAYKLAWRLATLASGDGRATPAMREVLIDLLAPAALGAIADVVPLVDENRVITRFGLSRVRGSRIEGIAALVAEAGLDGEDIDAEAVGFRLAPRLNACGRMGHAASAVELLTTATGDRAAAIAAELNEQNNQRRATERRIAEQAQEMAEAAGMLEPGHRAIVLAHPEWHPGVVGIVCSRLVERHHRPVILMQNQGEQCAGSGRSVDCYNLHAGLVSCAEHLTTFGGHDMAAGLKLDRANLDAFTAAFVAHANAHLTEADLVGRSAFDCDARIAELSLDAVRELARLGPFGRGNPRVRLVIRGATLNQSPKRMGNEGKHAQLWLGQDGAAMRCVAWNQGDLADDFRGGDMVDALVMPQISRWNGNTRVECEIADLRPATP